MKKSLPRSVRAALSIILALALIAPSFVMGVFAVPDDLPTALTAPEKLLVYDIARNYNTGMYNDNSDIRVGFVTPKDALSVLCDIDDYKYQDSGYDVDVLYQIDININGLGWQYDSYWDEYDGGAGSGFTSQIDGQTEAYTTSYVLFAEDSILENPAYAACFANVSAGDYNYSCFRYDTHYLLVRCRVVMQVINETSWECERYIYSDWSPAARYGLGGNQPDFNLPTEETLGTKTPAFSSAVVDYTGGYFGDNTPAIKLVADYDKDVLRFKGYNDTTEFCGVSNLNVYVEARLSVDGNTWTDEFNFNPSDPEIELYVSDLFEHLYPDESEFFWDGRDVYYQARYLITIWNLDTSRSNITGSWSTPQLVEIDPVAGYEITIEPIGDGKYDSDSDTDSFYELDGAEIDSIYCSPKEGCRVDSVTVFDTDDPSDTGTIMYDREDESTYTLLDWFVEYTAFSFKADDLYATKNITVKIVYGGSPTQSYKVFSNAGEGGSVSVNGTYVPYYVEVFSTVSPVEIHCVADTGYVIDSLILGDSGEISEAVGLEEYTVEHPALTSDITVVATFRRVSYHCSVSSTGEGTVNVVTPTDYYDNDSMVEVGDDLKVTFAANSGFDIIAVYIDGVKNDAAKAAGEYEFTDISSAHSVHVEFTTEILQPTEYEVEVNLSGPIKVEYGAQSSEVASARFTVPANTDAQFDFEVTNSSYNIVEVKIDDVLSNDCISAGKVVLPSVAANHKIDIKAVDSTVYYDVNVSGDGAGKWANHVTLSPSGESTVRGGNAFTLTINIDSMAFCIDGFTVNGVAAEPIQPNPAENKYTYTIPAVSEDVDIEITFAVIPLPGDVNIDGEVTTDDARLTLRYTVGLEEFTPQQMLLANVVPDYVGVTPNVTTDDARKILRYTVGLENFDNLNPISA